MARTPRTPAGAPAEVVAEQIAANQLTARRTPYMDGSGMYTPGVLSGMSFSDVGSSGLRQYGGWIREEFLPQLTGLQGARMYREMVDTSATVGAVLFAIQQLMRKVDWRVEPASDKPEAQEAADFVDSLRFDMSQTWEDHVTEALSMLPYGFAAHEIVYKARLGLNPPVIDGKPMPKSRFNDGRIGLRRLPIRSQDTVLKWFLDENGQLQGFTQQPYVGTLIDIPIEKTLLYRPTSHKNNPEGRSILRNSVRAYQFIKRLEEGEAITLERFGGLPTLYVPQQLMEAAQAGDANAASQLAQYKKIVTNIRVDEQMGVILPSNTYMGPNGPTNVRMYELVMTTPQTRGGQGQSNRAVIEAYKLDILMTVLADFIQLGHTARGTQNLALSKVDMFFAAIEGWLNGISAVINRYLLPRLWRINAMDDALMPELVPDLAQRVDLDAIGNYILHLAQSGMTMFPDVDLENFLRDAAGLPDISDETAYAATAQGADTDVLKRVLMASAARRVKRMRGA